MTQRTLRPEMPGTQPDITRASQGTGNFFATVVRARRVRQRRVYDIRTEGGEIVPGCDAVLGGPADDMAWVGLRVACMTMQSGTVVVVGPVAEDNPSLVEEVPPTSSNAQRPSQVGVKDRSIQHKDIKVIFGDDPQDLTFEIPGLLRIEAQGIRFSKGGATGAKVVMWGPFVEWAKAHVERTNAHDAWIDAEQKARPPGHPYAPATPFTVGTVEEPGKEVAVDTITVPEETP